MSKRNLLRLAAVVALAAVFAAIWFSPLRAQLTRENVRHFVEHLRGLWYGPLAFIVIFAAGCVFALPASLFIIAAGFIWGSLLGGIYSVIGGLLGAIASFYVARFIGAGLLDRFGRVGRAVAKQVDHAGFRSLLILRYIPGIPFVVLNYGAGVAGVSFGDFFAATLLGIAPSMFVFAYCADALFNGAMTQGDVFKRLAMVCGLMLTITLLPLLIKKLASKREPVAE
ncbi:MAG: TVP38/TMEM64 family protein [Acidobacteria bacterium]|nr:TVP38/TMEM64 family protein [Acidobacteriota bacterium]MBV9476976.1 TVP38/TMEM64 family protein [Acidobacteriota bacterium]